MFIKYGRVMYLWKAHGMEIQKAKKVLTQTTHFLLHPKNRSQAQLQFLTICDV